jgi:hypothetical protein
MRSIHGVGGHDAKNRPSSISLSKGVRGCDYGESRLRH